jgi:peptidyl-prolyl cis-trans isomerase D
MLDIMRKKAGSWMIKIILGAIVVVFVFWGVGSFNQSTPSVAKINGEPINITEYREAYNAIIERLTQSFGNRLDDDMIKTLGIKQQALNQVIDKKLLINEARRLGFKVSETELTDFIKRTSAFQINGIFNANQYVAVLKRNRMTPEGFEQLQKESMLIEKLRSFIADCAKVSSREALEYYNWSNAEVQIDYVLFEPVKSGDMELSADEIEAYYDDHKADYKTDTQIKARYIEFDPQSYKAKVEIAAEELKDYYDSQPDEFETPKTVEARHILLKLAPDADAEAVQQKLEQANKIVALAREGKDFAELATQYSEGPTKSNGGYLGTFKKETMVKPFADKAFSMTAGQISEPVRTQFGWHIIKVEKVNPATQASFDEVQTKISDKLAGERAKSLAYDEAETVYEAAFDGQDLTEIGKSRQLATLTTDFFTKNNPKIDVANPQKFASIASDLPVLAISDIQELGDRYYIIQVSEKILPQIPELTTVAERVKADLRKEKKKQKAENEAKSLLAALKSGKSLDEESKRLNLQIETTDLFKRNSPPAKIEAGNAIAAAAFKLSSQNPYPPDVIHSPKGYYVIRFNRRNAPDIKGFEKEEKTISQRLLQEKQRKTFEALLAKIRSTNEIIIEKKYLD